MKFIVRTFVLLILVNGGLVYMHYHDAGNATATSDVQLTYSQEIEVMNRTDGLYIRHHFTNLSTIHHEINWPETSTDRSCYSIDEDSCTRLNDGLNAFVEGESGKQSIMYVIPKKSLSNEMMLFEDVFARLTSSVPTSTMLHITDEMGLGGFWVNGLEQIGNKKMNLIDYTFYLGSGELTDLYWQSESLPLVYKGNKLSVYSSNKDINIEQFAGAETTLETIDAQHTAVLIQDDAAQQVNSRRILVSELESIDKRMDAFLINKVHEQFLIPREEHLTAEVVASMFSEKAMGSQKSRKVFEALNEHLSAQQLNLMLDRIHSVNEETINAEKMDEFIEEVTGFKSTFMMKNNNDHIEIYPYLLEEPRKVYIEGKEKKGISLLLKEGKTFYPITEIMQELGYTVSFNEQSLYIEDVDKKFRFPLRDYFYVYNERRFNVNSIPFERIGDEFYFEESTFIRVFLIEIDKTDEIVDIRPMTLFTEEANVN